MNKKIVNKSNTNVYIDNIVIKPKQSIVIEKENITEEAENRINSYLKLNAIKVFNVENDISTNSIKQRNEERKVEEVKKEETTAKKKSTRKKSTKTEEVKKETLVEDITETISIETEAVNENTEEIVVEQVKEDNKEEE